MTPDPTVLATKNIQPEKYTYQGPSTLRPNSYVPPDRVKADTSCTEDRALHKATKAAITRETTRAGPTIPAVGAIIENMPAPRMAEPCVTSSCYCYHHHYYYYYCIYDILLYKNLIIIHHFADLQHFIS